MPVFTFEKISPPPPDASPSPSEKPRGVIVQIIDRLVGVRVKSQSEEGGAVEKPPR